MSLLEWFYFAAIIQIIHGLGTCKLYKIAGEKAWVAFVPVYNALVLFRIINRPWYWIFFIFLPIINCIMFPVIWVETSRSFGKNKFIDTLLSVILIGFYSFYLSYFCHSKHVKNRSVEPKSSFGQFTSSILFAIVIASTVHIYFFQPFVIPSSSLEKSLLVGDFLIVSKMHYGARVPMTALSLPMVHDTIPLTNKKSYLFNDDVNLRESSWINKFQVPYLRIPGWDKVKRNEIVVFNQPADTLLNMNDFIPDRNYYKPIDKKTNLVKRCVGIPGDTLEIIDGFVYVNGKRNKLPERAKLQFSYEGDMKQNYDARSLGTKEILEAELDITDGVIFPNMPYYNLFEFPAATSENIDYFNNHPISFGVKSVNKSALIKGKREFKYGSERVLFPQDEQFPWNRLHFGPIFIPKKGETVEINIKNLPLYKRLISEYEGNTVYAKGNLVMINGESTKTYTFKQNYYWMMGDNRDNSIDARRWGFVPHDHIVGKPVFIWMSWNQHGKGLNKIRWDRVFSTVHGDGERKSYLIYFIIFLAINYVFRKWRKNRKKV
tara:strand:- start:73969 stop:75609 length:1641 start_codon:yes stop_codon:yes gene_type:complete